MIVVTLIRGISQWNSNNHSPVLTVGGDGDFQASGGFTPAQQSEHDGYLYKFLRLICATFQVESGDRMELGVSGTEYGMLAEGDMGRLTFQGTRSQF